MFNIRSAFFLLSLSLTSVLTATPAIADSFKVERVRYCTSPAAWDNKCPRGHTPGKFQAWQKHGVHASRQKQTYISIVSEPEVSKVKNVVFIAAGQQVEVNLNPNDRPYGYRNVLTGQPEDYKKNCNGRTQTCVREFRDSSLAMRLIDSGEFDMSETLFIIVLDSQYNYYLTTKDEMLEAYWEFLTTKFYPGTVDRIILAGQSRGGCLSFRLAERLRRQVEYKNIPLILQGYDPVCRNDGSEIPMTGAEFENPLNSSYKTMAVDLDQMFPRRARKDLYISNVFGGGKVGGLPIRAFTYRPEDTRYGWWEQKWVNYGHTRMGGGFDILSETVTPGLRHILNSLDKMERDQTPIVLGPVDINNDGLSDIIMREHVTARASRLTLKTKIAQGDGTFKTVTHESQNGPAVKAFPPLVGYFSKDRNTDIVFLERDRQRGLIIRTKISDGDGTYTEVDFDSGDGLAVDDFPALAGDVNGDGLTDIILRYRHPTDGLVVRTKFSNGDGTYAHKDWTSGDGSMVDKLQAFAADINADNKTDVILQYQSNDGYKIRSLISNGDGTFTHKEYGGGAWLLWRDLRTHVGDFNGDRKTDVMVHFTSQSQNLAIHTYLSQGDGTYDQKTYEAPVDNRQKYMLPAFVADLNGDRKTELIMRYRTSDTSQLWAIYDMRDNGAYVKIEQNITSPQEDDVHRVLLGAFNHSMRLREDVVLRRRSSPTADLETDTYWGAPTAPLKKANYLHSAEGVDVDAYEAITGPIHGRGRGGTFPACRPSVCADANNATGTLSVGSVSGLNKAVNQRVLEKTK